MRRYILSSALCLAFLVQSSAASHADPIEREVGVDLRYGNININNPLLSFLFGDDSATLIGVDVFGKFRVANALWVGARLPLAHMRWNEDGKTSLGNVTALLSYQLSSHFDSSSWVDTSLSFPTSDNDGDGGLVSSAFGLFWVPEPGLYVPDTTTISAMYRYALERQRQGVEFAGGMQVLAIDQADDRVRIPLRVAGHVGLGPSAQAIARFTTIWQNNTQNEEDAFLHVLEAGIGLEQLGQGRFELMLYYPLDDLYRNTLEVFGITLSVSSSL